MTFVTNTLLFHSRNQCDRSAIKDVNPDRNYFVYMMQSSSRRALYTGVTSKLDVRVRKHKAGHYEGFSSEYKCHRLLYYEKFSDMRDAIGREKQLKGWTRAKKELLIRKMNPEWRDLSLDWGQPLPPVDQTWVVPEHSL